jgi:alanine racemase
MTNGLAVTPTVTPFTFRPTIAEVDLAKIQFNFRALSGLLPKTTFVCPMIKADAYGHGDIEVGRALRQAGANHLGVNLVEEAIGLRQGGDKGELLTFALFDERGANAVVEFSLTPVVSDWYQLEAIEKVLKKRSGIVAPLKIHFKFNTGMSRLGFSVSEAKKLRERIDSRGFVLAGICTHLLRGDDAGVAGGESEAQFSRFSETLGAFADLNPIVHVLNSSGMINLSTRVTAKKPLGAGVTWPYGARPGIGIYGVAPSNDEGTDIHLQPALSLKSHLALVRQVRNGESVSYGATWRAKRDSVIGVVPLGYADGYMRLLSNKASVLCRGKRVPVTGIVCMDFTMIDLTDVVATTGLIAPGEEVVLIGEQAGQEITAQELATLIGTNPYEILTNISRRVPRVFR